MMQVCTPHHSLASLTVCERCATMSHPIIPVRKTLPKFSERVLTSTKILSQRSAVPAVFSRATPSENAGPAGSKRKAVTHDDKTRLLRMSKRLRRGPFNAFVDPNQLGEGSAMLELSEAAKTAGTYDVWEEEASRSLSVKVRVPNALGKPYADNMWSP